MRDLTPTQSKVLKLIQARTQRDGRPPTHDEIAKYFGWKSAFSVRQHLSLIEKKGGLQREKGKARAVRSRQTTTLVGIPLLGRIPAGPLLNAIETAGENLAISEGMFRGNRLFALRVDGDSMKCAGIHHGDIAVINHEPEVREGEIAAVRNGDDSTLKRVFRTSTGLLLKADNPEFEDILIPAGEAKDCRVAGRLVGLIRQKI
jgi:repressor LexA